MGKMKIGTLRTMSIEMKRRLRYWVVFIKLFYKSILGKGTQGNRPLFPDFAVDLFLCYNKWTIASESVDELIGIRIATALDLNLFQLEKKFYLDVHLVIGLITGVIIEESKQRYKKRYPKS
jgi:hypothetical protein